MEEKIHIPKGVTSEKDYYILLDLQEELKNHPQRYFQTSNPKLKIDLSATVYIIGKQIRDLPQEEKDKILEATKPIRSLLGKIGTTKRAAYGTLDKKKDDNNIGPLDVRNTELLELFGRFFTIREVHKIVLVEWEYDISIEALERFYKANVDKIEELKKEYELSYSDVRLGKRRARLDEYSFLFSKTKDKYVKYESRDDAKLMQGLLESIKKEIDGDLVVNGKLQVDIEHTINLQVQQELLKEFNITSLIINKLAGRLNINPSFLISRLARSHYAKFTGFGQATKEERDGGDIYNPTGITYDWDSVVNDYAKIAAKDEEQKQLPEIEEAIIVEENNKPVEVATLSIKEIMLQKIKQEQEQLNKVRVSVDVMGKGTKT